MKNVIKNPHISEKTTHLMQESNEYVFVVDKNANKIEIAEAVKEIYKVDVEKVRIISIPSKKRRLGLTVGKKKGYKKAIVKVKDGQKIDILSS